MLSTKKPSDGSFFLFAPFNKLTFNISLWTALGLCSTLVGCLTNATSSSSSSINALNSKGSTINILNPSKGTNTQQCPVWSEGPAYNLGQVVSYQGQSYTCITAHTAFVGTGWNPVAAASLWSLGGNCGAGNNPAQPPLPGTVQPTPNSPNPDPAPNLAPAPGTKAPVGFIFSPYKDVTINMNWNTNLISTKVTGSATSLINAMPSGLNAVTWAFATGECGSETWGGVQPAALVSANLQAMVNAGKSYVISTGGQSGVFTCSTDAGFAKFINTYYSANMLGVDFDIEGGQTQSDINNLVQRVLVAQKTYPNLRFSFTLQTLGTSAAQNLNSLGLMAMQAIQGANLQKYTIDLMAMDYGSPSPSVCAVGSNGLCDMGQSAINAANTLHNLSNVPYNQIELCPMIGGNDQQDETFTLSNVATISRFAIQSNLAGIHFWSFDRDNDCPAGSASPTCNSYGLAGALGFTNQFITSLGLK